MAKKDLGVIQADKEFLKLEKRLNKIYKEAGIDVQHKMDVYFAKYQKKNDTWLAKLKAAKNTDDYPQLQKDYQKWLKGQVFQGKQWEYKKESIASALTNINQVAVNMINDTIPDVFQFNGNYAAYQLEQGAGVDFGFNMYDSATVKQIIAEDKNILPFKKLDKAKDVKWNFRSIKNEVAKGIIEGESIDKISKRLATVIPDRNKSMLRTHARTMVTSAQNAGRLERFKDAENKGLEMEKEWFCTLDGRTRDTHRLLDRQRKPLDEPFEVDGFKIMYPADPHAHPSMVYNCRCTMNSYLKKYPPQYTTRSARDDNGDSVLIKDMSYKEWEEWKNGGKEVTKPTKTSTLKGLKKPTRPNKDDFTDPTKFEDARALYREQRKVYNEKVSQWVNSSVPKETSFEDFKAWTEMQDIKIYGDISKVDKRALTAYKERMNQLFKDFPEVKSYRTLFDIPKENQYYEFAFQNTLDFIAEANHGFTFGSSGVDIISLLTTQADDVASGFRTLGDGTINQLFDHEFGHNVYDWLKHIEDRSEEGFQRRLKLEKDLVNSVYNKKGASEYSSTNTEELFAEAFSAWYGGEQTEFAKAMGDFLKRWDVI